jgi:hypothetical protein
MVLFRNRAEKVHHQFFTHHDLTFNGHKEWRALLFPPFAPAASR